MIKKIISGKSNVKNFINQIIDGNTKINITIEKEVDKILEKGKYQGQKGVTLPKL